MLFLFQDFLRCKCDDDRDEDEDAGDGNDDDEQRRGDSGRLLLGRLRAGMISLRPMLHVIADVVCA